MTRGWLIWITLCLGALLTTTIIASAAALHSPHHNGKSVAFCVLVTLGVEAVITVFVNFIRWLEKIRHGVPLTFSDRSEAQRQAVVLGKG